MKTVLNVKTDEAIKKKARRLASDLGISLSAVVNAYLRQFVHDRELHLSLAPRMTLQLEALLDEIHKDIKTGQNFSKAIKTPKALDEYFASL